MASVITSLRTVILFPLQIANTIHQRPVALAHPRLAHMPPSSPPQIANTMHQPSVALKRRRLAHMPPNSARSPKASLIWIRHELTVLPHTKNALEMLNVFKTCFIHPTATKALTCLPSLLILAVSPQMESLLDPPQTSQSHLSAKDLYVVPMGTAYGDVTRLEVLNHGLRTCASLGDRVLHVRIAEKGDGEVWELSAPTDSW